MLISPISHCFCWPLIPKHQAKQWNYVYGEIRSIGLCPVIFPAVKLIHKNISSLELEHSTSLGEHFCKNAAKEIYPSREGARTTYMWGKMSPEHCKWCTAPVLALPRAGFLPACPFPHTATEQVPLQGSAQSITAAITLLLSISFSRMKLLRLQLWLQKKVRGERSQQELPHAVNPPKTPSAVTLCLFIS